MMKLCNSLLSVTLAIAVAGCSIFVSKTQTITIDGEPKGASVIVNGQKVNAPTLLDVPRNQTVKIMVHKDGYHPYPMTGRYSINTFGILDLVGGWFIILPWIGLAFPGAFSLDQTSFYYIMTPLEQK